jgi:hypothetical protein
MTVARCATTSWPRLPGRAGAGCGPIGSPFNLALTVLVVAV